MRLITLLRWVSYRSYFPLVEIIPYYCSFNNFIQTSGATTIHYSYSGCDILTQLYLTKTIDIFETFQN